MISNLKKERLDHNLTLEEVADALDMTAAMLSLLENGKRFGSRKTQLALSKYYRRSVDYLFFS